MTRLDLQSLSLKELEQLQRDVAREIESAKLRHKREALAAVQAQAKHYGYDLAELVEPTNAGGKPRLVSPAKYRHPENAALTWSGRGRRPGWVAECLASGKTLNDLAI